MIDWKMTEEQFGRTDLSGTRPRVAVVCDSCGATSSKTIRKKSDVVNNQLSWQCNKCIANRPEKKAASAAGAKKSWENSEYRKKIVANSKKIWEDGERRKKMSAFRNSPDFKQRVTEINRKKVTPEFRRKMSMLASKQWSNPEYRRKMTALLSEVSKQAWAKPEYRQRIRNAMLKNWENTNYKDMILQAMHDNWQDPDFRTKMLAIFGSDEFRAKMSKISRELWCRPEYRAKVEMTHHVSSIQEVLYSILSDLGVEYYREYADATPDPQCVIGPYTFDCVVPRNNQPDLLIECQGEYWHAKEEIVTRDRAKASYINNNFPGQYEVKYLWEHEFYNENKIIELLKYWLDITQIGSIEFDLSRLKVKSCPASDYKLLLSKYHYLPNAGRGGIAYGAYLEDKLAAVCVFSPLGRQNIKIPSKYSMSQCRELSRLCIHPRYQKKNLASWFVSRCLKALDKKYKFIISYCDTTFNHNGATYKACNFKLDGEVKPDYWYVSEDGWVMHKRTLYGRAIRMGMKEREYAEVNGYKKVWGKKKLRFIYDI